MTLNTAGIMAEATRLTRNGELREAMALIQTLTAPVPEPSARDEPLHAHNPAITTALARLDLSSRLAKLLGLFGKRVPRDPVVTPPEKPISFKKAPVPGKARFEERSFANAAGTRSYKLFIPETQSKARLPLIVMLHGCTQSPDDFALGTGMNELANKGAFFVAYPAQPTSANPARCWNWFSTGDQSRDRGEPSIIAGLTRQIMADHPIDPQRVYVAGLSAGGAAAAIMGQTYPDLYAAVGVHSGLACGAASDMMSGMKAMRQGGPVGLNGAAKSLPTIVFHGDRDATVSPLNGQQVIDQATADGSYHVSYAKGRSPGGIAYTRAIHADAKGQSILEHWVLHGGGHAWSGGHAGGSFTDPRGPDASAEMVRFFLAHKRQS